MIFRARSAFVVALAVMLALTLVPIVSAQQPAHKGSSVGGFFDFGFSTSGIKSDVAQREGMGTRGYGFALDMGLTVKDVVVLGVGGGGQYVKDNDPLSYSTTGGTFGSKCNIGDFSVFAGLRTPRMGPVRFGANVGRAWVAGTRGVDTPGNTVCIDCESQSVRVGGGAFVEPYIAFSTNQNFRVVFAYRQFGSSVDVQNQLLINFGISR